MALKKKVPEGLSFTSVSDETEHKAKEQKVEPSKPVWLDRMDFTKDTCAFKFMQRVRSPGGQGVDTLIVGANSKYQGAQVEFCQTTGAYIISVDGKVSMVLHNVQCVEVVG